VSRTDQDRDAAAGRAAGRRQREQVMGSCRRGFDWWLSQLTPDQLAYVHGHLPELLLAAVGLVHLAAGERPGEYPGPEPRGSGPRAGPEPGWPAA
jgi:hypothetical protein